MTTLTVSLREATDDDRDLLRAVYAQARSDELALVPWSAPAKAAFCAQQSAAQETGYRARWPGGRSLVVEVGPVAAGRLYVGDSADEVRVVDIALLPEFRGRGIGTSLLGRVIADAERRAVPVVLHVEHGSRARRLYERLGFRETGRTDVHARMERRPGSLS